MSTILYHMVDGKVEDVMVEAVKVHGLLKSGYAVTPEDLSDDDLTEEEIKQLAIDSGIKIGNKKITTLRKELDL